MTDTEENDMILDTIEHAGRYDCLGPQWKTAFDAIRAYDPARFRKGEAILLDHGVKLLQFEPTTRPRDQVKLEAHRRFADVMILAAGEESIAWKPTAQLRELTMEYDPAQDALLAKMDDDALEIPMRPGRFVVFLPQDAHGPDCAAGPCAAVRRIVIKVPLDD